jgi:hypothetical protein
MPSSIACLKLAPPALLLACVLVAPARADRAAFIGEHRCAVTERLERIHARGDRATSKDRFLAITTMWRGAPQAYVQCIFFENDTKMYCEASSGFYERKPEERRVAPVPGSITAIAALGFSTDPSEGNFSQEIDLGDPPDVSRAADLMLSTLHDAYGARLWTELKYNAPFAPTLSRTPRPSRCIPTS